MKCEVCPVANSYINRNGLVKIKWCPGIKECHLEPDRDFEIIRALIEGRAIVKSGIPIMAGGLEYTVLLPWASADGDADA